jgi:hypothetical protein
MEMEHDAEFMLAIYEKMREAGLVSSSAEFSVKMLQGKPSRLDSIALGERPISSEVLDHLEARMLDVNHMDRQEIDRYKRELTVLLYRQNCRSEVLSSVNDFRQRMAEKDIDDLLDGEISDEELLATLLANAGLDRIG